MTREEAATLLGIDIHAEPESVRRAWRVWARLAHPDAGGDVEHFRRLAYARDVLLADTELDPHPDLVPSPRPPLRAMCKVPTPGALVRAGMLTAVAVLAVLPARAVDPWIAALVLGISAAAAGVMLQRAILACDADVGHRIAFLAFTWVPIAAFQIAAMQVLHSSIVTALPAMALPFVVSVAMVNPGAGLWRPISLARDSR